MSRNWKNKKKYTNKGKGTSNKSANSNSNVNKEKQFTEGGLDASGRDNDPNYYFASAELAKQAAQLSFQSIVGSGPLLDEARNPGILVIGINPSLGNSFAFSNAPVTDTVAGRFPKKYLSVEDAFHEPSINGANLMLTKQYTLLSAWSGRTTQYQPCDLGMMEGAISAFAEVSEHVRRVLGLATLYNPRNRLMPIKLIKACGVEPQDLLNSLPAYRMRFNSIISRMNQIPLLDNIAYIRKSREIFQKIYTDSDTSMSQYIVMVPATTWILDEQTRESGSYLKTIPLTAGSTSETGDSYNASHELSWWMDVMESQVNALLESTTLNIVYADLMHLASKISVPMWKFDYCPEGWYVKPEYNENFILQMHNMTCVGNPRKLTLTTAEQALGYKDYTMESGSHTYHMPVSDQNDVLCVPDTGYIFYNPCFTGNNRFWHEVLIDFPTSDPNDVDIIESMRFTTAFTGWEVTNTLVITPTISDHYVVYMTLWDEKSDYCACITSSNRLVSVAAWDTMATDQVYMGRINHGPRLYYSGDTSNSVKYVTGDTDFYTLVDGQYLTRVNRLMFEGLFDFRTGSSK